ncbi:MAG: HAD hydrolase-like protein [Erysipelotrichaceae bacterium]
MNKKYIIWDWNGTLLNDVDLCLTIINQLLNQYHLKPFQSLQHYREVFSFPVSDYYEAMGFDFNKTPFSKLAKEYMDMYQPASHACQLHDGVQELMQELHQKGFHQVILSASQIDNLKSQLNNYDITKYLDHILGIQDIHAASKQQLASDYLSETKIPLSEVVFIGDSIHDYEVASANHCDCILIANGHQSFEKLSTCDALILPSIKEIKQQITFA